MERKPKLEESALPILIPIDQKEFFDRIRAVVQEELKLFANAGDNGSVHHVDGLTYKPLYDIAEVRQLFGNVSRTTIYEWIEAGLLKPRKMKGRVYFLWEDIVRSLDPQDATP